MKDAIATLVLVLVLAGSSRALGQVPEIADPYLPDIAMVRRDASGGLIIVYNPTLCAQAGLSLCRFYRAHEHGHIALGHAFSGAWPPQKEAEADCWAAKNASPDEVQAALKWFNSGGGASWQHGTGPQRAATVQDCYEKRGKVERPAKSRRCLRECRGNHLDCNTTATEAASKCIHACSGLRGGSHQDCLDRCRRERIEARDGCLVEKKECDANCND